MYRLALALVAYAGLAVPAAARLHLLQTDFSEASVISATATTSSSPLFTDVPDGIAAASTLPPRNLPTDVQIVQTTTSAGVEQPAIKVVNVDTQLLLGPARKLSLPLPGGLTLTANRLTKFNTRVASASLASSGIQAASSTTPAGPGVTMWTGEVNGARGAFSSVTLVKTESGGVYGKVRWFDRSKGAFRTFRVSPVISDQLDPAVAAATAAATTNSTTTAPSADLYPTIDPTKHVIFEYVEPDYITMAHRGPKPPKPDNVTSSYSASSTIDTTSANATSLPPPPKDAATLAATMAATAGPETAGNMTAADFLAAANDWLQGKTITATAPVALDSTAGAANGQGRRLLQTSYTRQDILIVYTANAASALGGVSAIENRIRVAVAEVNKYYVDSNVPILLNLVGVSQISWNEYTKPNEGAGGPALADAQKGNIANLAQMRDDLGADFVSIWYRTGDAKLDCGLGYVDGGANWAFSSVASQCADSLTLAHELGHNQGCGHNWDDDKGARSFGYGFRRCDLGSNGFMTIMSYSCTNGGSSPRFGLLSNPNGRIKGYAAGDANTAHCARRVTDNRVRDAGARQAKPSQNGRIFTTLNTQKCLDTPTYTTGVQLTIYDCHGGANQQWELRSDSSIRSVGGGNKCVDVRSSGTSDGTVVQLWDCNGTPAQKWFRDAQNRLHPYAAPDKCMDITGGRDNNGNTLVIWGCHTGTNQQWQSSSLTLPPVFSPQGSMIQTPLNGLCLDVFAFNFVNTGGVVTWPCNGLGNQRWFLDDTGRIKSMHNDNFCLDASAPNNGATVYVYSCHIGYNQRWFQDDLGRLRNFLTPSKCLDVRGANTAQQTAVQLWDCVDSPQQKWAVKPV